jgi:DNA-binding NtrC family response regulator
MAIDFRKDHRKELPEIVFLDDSENLRELMPVLLESALGVQCITFGNLAEFENHSGEVLRARVAILDINLGPNAPDGVDAYNWLMHHGFHGKILFFTGHARTNPRVARAERQGVQVLEKPLHPEELISFVTRALNDES